MNNKPYEQYFPDAVAEVKGFSIFMLDADGVIKTWNHGCELMKGYTAEEAIGLNFDMLFPDFLINENLHINERQLAKTHGRYEMENWRKKKNGELFWASVVLTKVLDEEGIILALLKLPKTKPKRKNTWIN